MDTDSKDFINRDEEHKQVFYDNETYSEDGENRTDIGIH